VRRSHSDPYLSNGGVSAQEGNASSTSIGNGFNHTASKIKAKGRRWKWSWRHWLFAIAAGVVGVGDGEWEDRGDKGKEEKVICTTPGGICAGETETETDEPVSDNFLLFSLLLSIFCSTTLVPTPANCTNSPFNTPPIHPHAYSFLPRMHPTLCPPPPPKAPSSPL